ncbi:hypothetical protein ACVGWV_08665, partial [Enterobacter asburiae]
ALSALKRRLYCRVALRLPGLLSSNRNDLAKLPVQCMNAPPRWVWLLRVLIIQHLPPHDKPLLILKKTNPTKKKF